MRKADLNRIWPGDDLKAYFVERGVAEDGETAQALETITEYGIRELRNRGMVLDHDLEGLLRKAVAVKVAEAAEEVEQMADWAVRTKGERYLKELLSEPGFVFKKRVPVLRSRFLLGEAR